MKITAEEVAELLRVMAHQERLMVLCQLTQSEMGVGPLQQGSTLSQSVFHNTLLCCESTALSSAQRIATGVLSLGGQSDHGVDSKFTECVLSITK